MKMATYNVELRFQPSSDWDQARLEDAAVDVSELLESSTPESVFGVAVSVCFEPPALEIELAVRASTDSEFHQILSDVLRLLEDPEIGESGYAEHSRREPVLA